MTITHFLMLGLTLDLETVKQYGVPVLIVVGVYKLFGDTIIQKGKGLLSVIRKTTANVADELDLVDPHKEQTETGSDKPAPPGFAEHVKTVLQASPAAPPDLQLKYLARALCEAETLREEVKRLSNPEPDEDDEDDE